MPRLVETLAVGRLTRLWKVALESDLRPALAEEITQVPAGLHRKAKGLFVRRHALTPALSEAKKHLCE